MRIGILNAYTKTALALARDLEGCYDVVGVVPARSHRFGVDPARFFHDPSFQRVIRLPGSFRNASAVTLELEAEQLDIIIPVGHELTRAFAQSKEREEAPNGPIVPLSGWSLLRHFMDKWLMYRLAVGCGIPTPTTLLWDGSLDRVEKELGFPLVAKPRDATGSKGVKFLADRIVARETLAACKPGDWVLQAQVSGELYDVGLLAFAGEVTASLSMRRLLTLEAFGGGGVINQTVREPEILNYAQALAAKTSWSGILEIDFIKTDRGFLLLEANPRFWGTTEIAMAAGLPLARDLITGWTGNELPPVRDSWKEGLVFRWLYPDCAYSCLRSWRRPSEVLRRLRTMAKPSEEASATVDVAAVLHSIGITLEHLARDR